MASERQPQYPPHQGKPYAKSQDDMSGRNPYTGMRSFDNRATGLGRTVSWLSTRCDDGEKKNCQQRSIHLPVQRPEGQEGMYLEIEYLLNRGRFSDASRLVSIMSEGTFHGGEYSVGWRHTVQILVARTLIASGRTSDALQVLSRVFEQTLNVAIYREQLLDTTFWLCILHYMNQERSLFVSRANLFCDLPDPHYVTCPCAFKLRGYILTGLMNLWNRNHHNAAHAFRKVLEYRDLERHYAQMARLGIAEAAYRDNDAGTALDHLTQVDMMLDSGIGHGAVLMWLPVFPKARDLAGLHFAYWPHSIEPNALLAEDANMQRPGAELEIHAFTNEVIFYGKKADFSEGSYGRPALALLVYLAYHPDGASMEQIVQDLWPGKTSSMADHAYSYLRERLGTNMVARKMGIFKLEGSIWFDGLIYEAGFRQMSKTPFEQSYRVANSLAPLYHSGFLNGINMAWVESKRQQYSEMQGYIYYQMAAVYARSGWTRDQKMRLQFFQEAIRYLRLALEVSPFFDAAVEAMMRLLYHVHQKSSAVILGTQYQKRTQEVWSTDPSPIIMEIMRRFREEPEAQLTAAFSREDLLHAVDLQLGGMHDYDEPDLLPPLDSAALWRPIKGEVTSGLMPADLAALAELGEGEGEAEEEAEEDVVTMPKLLPITSTPQGGVAKQLISAPATPHLLPKVARPVEKSKKELESDLICELETGLLAPDRKHLL